MEHFDAIRDSPPHVYHSALPLCPTSSWLRVCYSTELSQEVKVIRGLQTTWGACLHTNSLDTLPYTLAGWKDIIAVGLVSNDIAILDIITGVHISTLSGHTDQVNSLTFSSDGTVLVSGGRDQTVRLWDMQTGGAIKTFCGHTERVSSVSISLDCTMIASGSWDNTIYLWDVRTGECCCIINKHSKCVSSVSFSPTSSQIFMSASYDNTIRWWDISGHQIGPTYEDNCISLSSDGALFVSWGKSAARVRNSNSGRVIAELQVSGKTPQCCCFSPDGKFVAGGVGPIIYIWDITNSETHLVEAFVGHTNYIISLTFSPSNILSSSDGHLKFWQIGTSPVDPVTTDPESALLTPAPITAINLQTNDGIAISGDSAGVVRSWDILTGLCNQSFHTPAKDLSDQDIRLINGRLIVVWYYNGHVYIWDTEKRGLPQAIGVLQGSWVMKPKISENGSQIILLGDESVQAWSVQNGEALGGVEWEGELFCRSTIVQGSRIWAHFNGSETLGWDFGISCPAPVLLSNVAPDSPNPNLCFKGWDTKPYRIKDRVTGNEVFRLSGKFADPADIQWDGQHLVAGYISGAVLILDFDHVLPQQGYGVSIQACDHYMSV